ncbi:MAG: hypothetical protein Q4B28_00355 [bacterium]|nr:hypothetical protein [bacterium]
MQAPHAIMKSLHKKLKQLEKLERKEHSFGKKVLERVFDPLNRTKRLNFPAKDPNDIIQGVAKINIIANRPEVIIPQTNSLLPLITRKDRIDIDKVDAEGKTITQVTCIPHKNGWIV